MINNLKLILKLLLWSTALTPIFKFTSLLYPYNSSKVLFFRVVIELTAIIFIVYQFLLSRSSYSSDKKNQRMFPPGSPTPQDLIRHPLFIAILIFFISLAFSTIFAGDRFHAFWGNLERGDGFFSLFHYLVFLTLSLIIFERKDWLTFFKTSVGVGFFTLFYAWLQYSNVRSFPFALEPITKRAGSFFDNPALFSTYLIFIVGLAGLLLVIERNKKSWFYFSLFTGVSAAITIFLTDVRGAILGLVIGFIVFLTSSFVFSLKRPKSGTGLRNWSILVLGSVTLGIVLFLVTRQAVFWQFIPGLNRIASFSFSDSSLQTRLIALNSSWQAIQEKPILGWGLENYNVAYNQYYNPQHAAYEEAWFDRAHNKIAEIAVTQGLVGVLSYLSIFGVAIYLLFRKNNSPPPGYVKLVLISLLTAYFIQNLFLFDAPVSYLMWFATLGFLISETRASPESRSSLPQLTSGLALVLIPILLYSLYAYHFVPYRQSKAYLKIARTGVMVKEEIISAQEEFLKPYNFVQPTLRYQFLSLLNDRDLIKENDFKLVNDLAINALKEVIQNEPGYDPRNYLLLGEVYNTLGAHHPETLKDGEVYLRKAVALIPSRQDAIGLLAFNLAGQGRFEESIALNRSALDLNRQVATPHLNLGLSLLLAGKNHWDEAEQEFTIALEIGFINHRLLENNLSNISAAFEAMLLDSIEVRNVEKTVRLAQKLKKVYELLKLDPSYAVGLETITTLAQKGDWAAIDLVIGQRQK